MTTARGTALHRQGTRAPRTARRPKAVVYPETDGKPMAETPIHYQDMVRIEQTLTDRYRDDPTVLVGANIMLYWVEGDARQSISPDVYVTKGVDRDRRRDVYLVWVEGPPVAVFEITSKSTRSRDRGRKRDIYAQIGVREYYLYDPLGEWLVPPLRGYRLTGAGTYEQMATGADGSLLSTQLGLRLVLEGGRLRLYDVQSGLQLRSPAERAEAEAERADAEAEARRAAEARIAELEALLRQNPPPPA